LRPDHRGGSDGRPEQPTKLAAIMSAEVVGYSRLMAENEVTTVAKVDSTWIAEQFLSTTGGYAEKEAELFINGARKAGLPDCIPAGKLKDMPNLIRVKSSDQQRAKISG
jgi:hypothetical protein